LAEERGGEEIQEGNWREREREGKKKREEEKWL